MQLMRRLYDWVLGWAHRRGARRALFGLATVEASVLPIPPDPLLITLAFGRPSRAWQFALICTVGSVLGGCLGYLLGAVAQEFITIVVRVVIDGINGTGALLGTMTAEIARNQVTGDPLVFGSQQIYQDGLLWKVMQLYQGNAFLAVLGAALTPVPYIIFTIAGGYCQINFATFLIASVLGRGGRYFTMAGLIYFFGAPMKALIERYFGLLTLAFFVLLVGGYLGIKYVL